MRLRTAVIAALVLLLTSCGTTADRTRKARTAATRGAPGRLPAASGLRLPRGFRAEIYARGVPAVTAMAFGPDRRLYATEQGGAVVALHAGSRGGRPLARFKVPLGLVWRRNRLYVSAQGTLSLLRLQRGQLVDRRTLVARLPFGRHQQDNVLVGTDGRVYFGSGSTCDACVERDARSATVLSVRPDGSDLQIVARGLRNPFGLARDVRTGRIYVSVNGQDTLGSPRDPEPAEMVVLLKRGAWYGWPGCWPSARLERMMGSCDGVTEPSAYLEPHASADGIVVYRGASFPPQYGGNLFVAEWGQYNSRRFGRRVVRVVLRKGRSGRVSVFASGFAHPLALTVDRRGALLVSDWQRGLIYRIQARGRS